MRALIARSRTQVFKGNISASKKVLIQLPFLEGDGDVVSKLVLDHVKVKRVLLCLTSSFAVKVQHEATKGENLTEVGVSKLTETVFRGGSSLVFSRPYLYALLIPISPTRAGKQNLSLLVF